jgi:branched-chain amino acid transport system substrate-binding protein
MTRLRAALVTPLTGPLARYGRATVTGLTLWAEHAARLPPIWADVALEAYDTGADAAAAMRAAIATRPDVLFGPYGSSPMLTAARATSRLLWNHSGATSQLCWPAFPHVINVLAPASSYFAGVLQAVRAVDPGAATVTIFHVNSSFGQDVAAGAARTAAHLGFTVQVIGFEPGSAVEMAATLPGADILLVAGGFADELAVAPLALARPWRAVAFVGAGVEEVLAPLGNLREGLLGPAQWVATAAPQPDEGPDAGWFVAKYREAAGEDPPYPAVQAFAAGIICARCLRESGTSVDVALLTVARRLVCTTLYGKFQLDPVSGLQVGHQVVIVQWQDGMRRVVWPPEQAESQLRYPFTAALPS